MNQSGKNPKNTIFDTKRLIGCKFGDAQVQKDLELFPFKVVAGPGDRPQIEVDYLGEKKLFFPE